MSKAYVQEVIDLFKFCETYKIRPPNSNPREIAIWRLVYGATLSDRFYVTYLGTFEEATRKLFYLAERNPCGFQGFRIENSWYKISPTVASLIRANGGCVLDQNIDR